MHFLKSSNSICLFLIILIFSPVLLAAEDEMVFSLAAEGNSEELGEALQDFPDINKTDTNGMTLLLSAVLYGNLKNTVALLEAGATSFASLHGFYTGIFRNQTIPRPLKEPQTCIRRGSRSMTAMKTQAN